MESGDGPVNDNPANKLNRRNFLATAGAAGFMIVKPQAVRGSQANSAVRIGLLGCGGRGTADASGFVKNTPALVVALADMFQDKLDAAKARFGEAQQVIDPSQVFLGPKAFQEIANSKQVDMVIITSPPYFHPEHLEAVVKAGKHVFVEKPVAVDVPGCKRVLAIGESAEGKLSVDVGFQLRMAPPYVELVKRVHAGAIGEIAYGEAHYYYPFLPQPDYPNASPAERRLRHWLHDRVLSGDIIVEQNIHVIDMCNWILGDHPIKAVGTGGRKGRSEEGDAWGHFSLTFYYPNDVHVTFASTQFGSKFRGEVSESFFGTRGKCQTPYTGPVTIEGEEPWKWAPVLSSNIDSANDEKQKAFIDSITSRQYHNQVASGVTTALTCIMGRAAAYTGKVVTWDEISKSKETLDARLNLEKL
jgi:myo-inositol 2-dehydrogenase/D-chiro-inositol 1-dehydrogenase